MKQVADPSNAWAFCMVYEKEDSFCFVLVWFDKYSFFIMIFYI
jgi:hypothetical protein